MRALLSPGKTLTLKQSLSLLGSFLQIIYLDFLLSINSLKLTLNSRWYLQSIHHPYHQEGILPFLELVGYLRAWILNFGLLACPLF